MKRSKALFALATVAVAATSTPAFAGTANGSMIVSATVLESCTVVATPMVFGSLTAVGAGNVDSTASLALVCTPNADFDIALGDGANASGSQRRLKNALSAEYLNYDLYMDSNRAQPWGNTAGTTKAGTAPLGVANYTVYGRIPSGVSSVSAGAYADTVTVTVTF